MNGQETVLLVDDEESVRKLLGMTLTEMGYRVLTAGNGSQALRVFEEQRPAIVLTDVKMPGMDGLEMLARVKSIDPEAEVIMITGHGDMELAIESIKRQATDFVPKPVNDDVLEIALNRARERLALRRQLRAYTGNLERLVAEKSRELLAAERFAAVGQTAAFLAHAIKNLVSGLEGGLFLLDGALSANSGGISEHEARQARDVLAENVVRVKRLALELLRLGTGQPPRLEPVSAEAPARRAVRALAAKALEMGVELKLAETPAETLLAMDVEAVAQSLMNLIDNGLEACARQPADRRRVVLTVRVEPPDAVYAVRDGGPGVPEALRERLFHAFVTGKSGPGQTGTGVGLLFARRTAEAHGGQARLAETSPEGSVFELRLPLRAARVEPGAHVASIAEASWTA